MNRDELLTLASAGSGPALAAKFSDFGLPTVADRIFNMWLGGASPTDLYLAAEEGYQTFVSTRPAAPQSATQTMAPTARQTPDGGAVIEQNGAILAQYSPQQIAASGGWRKFLGAVAPIVGGLVGGPAGAAIGGAIGGSFGSVGGNSGLAGLGPTLPAPATPGISGVGGAAIDILGGGAIGAATSWPSDLANILLGGATGGGTPGGSFGDQDTTAAFGPGYLPPGPVPVSGGPVLGMTAPTQTTRMKAANGNVVVTIKPGHILYDMARTIGYPAAGGSYKVQMPKALARQYKLWKAPVKPLLTSSERRTIRKAETLRRKVARVAKSAGVNCTTPRKRAPRTRK